MGLFFLDENENINHRHNTLKNYLENRNWDKNPQGNLIEFDLVKDVVKNLHERKPVLKNFIYIYDYEWEVIPGRTDKKKGDLIFTDGKNNFLIVECKLKDSTSVRKQVLIYINEFKKIKSKLNKICGLAVTQGDWDYYDENGIWHYEKTSKNSKYLRSYDGLILKPDQINAKNNFQDYYRSIGYKPTDPTSALNQLKQQNFLDIKDNYDSLENKQPFLIVIKAKLKKNFLKDLEGKGEAPNKDKARMLASADICEQIFLEYDMSNLKIPIDEIEKGEVYRITKMIVK